MTFAHGETVTRQRATVATDPYSGEAVAEDWSTPVTLTISGCAVSLSGTTEPLIDARDAVDSDFDVFMPAGTDVTARDRLVIRGVACDVVGRPFTWTNPMTGWTPGMVVQAKVREG